MSNEKATLLKASKGALVSEVNGVTYFKLKSEFDGDYTKNCGLLGEEIDKNFYFLRGYDIDTVEINEDRNLVISRVDKDYDPIIVNLAEEMSRYIFDFDKERGCVIITFPDGTIQEMGGFLVEGKDIRIATDSSLKGNGTIFNPLGLSEVYKTGTYEPAHEFVDLTESTKYYYKMTKKVGGVWVCYYKELDGPIPDSEKPSDVDLVDLKELPNPEDIENFPSYIRVSKKLDGNKMLEPKGKGYRVVTKEKLDKFGYLYPFKAVELIDQALKENMSQWRIPTKSDWDELLNAFEPYEENRNHEGKTTGTYGRFAGSNLKSYGVFHDHVGDGEGMWRHFENLSDDADNAEGINLVDREGWTLYPLGHCPERNFIMQDKDADAEGFTKLASFWTSTKDATNNAYAKTFAYNSPQVLQNSFSKNYKLSLRLCKDYTYSNFNEIEEIMGIAYPCSLVQTPFSGCNEYAKIWTSVNISLSDPIYSGVTSEEWTGATESLRGINDVYFINEWDGVKWVKKPMNEGDSVVIVDYDYKNGTYVWNDKEGKWEKKPIDDRSGIYNHEWRIFMDSEVTYTEDELAVAKDTGKTYIKDTLTVVKDCKHNCKDCDKNCDTCGNIYYITNAGSIAATTDSIKLPKRPILVDTANSIKGEIQKDIDRIDDKTDALQEELDNTQKGAGLAEDGSYIVNEGSNYLSGATSLADADNILDNELKSVSDKLDEEIEKRITVDENIADLIGFDGNVESGLTLTFSQETKSYEPVSEEDLTPEDLEVVEELDEMPTEITEESAPVIKVGEEYFILTRTENTHFVADEETVKDAIIKLDDELFKNANALDELSASTTELSAVTTVIEENLDNLSASTLELSAATVEEIKRLDDRIDKETEERKDNDIETASYNFESEINDNYRSVKDIEIKRHNGEVAVTISMDDNIFDFGTILPEE